MSNDTYKMTPRAPYLQLSKRQDRGYGSLFIFSAYSSQQPEHSVKYQDSFDTKKESVEHYTTLQFQLNYPKGGTQRISRHHKENFNLQWNEVIVRKSKGQY